MDDTISINQSVEAYACYSLVFCCIILHVVFYLLFQVEKDIYCCAICGIIFESVYSLRQHAAEAHDGKCQIMCPHCQKHFNCVSKLLDHIVSHTLTKEFKCNLCEKEYRYKRNYVAHLKTH